VTPLNIFEAFRQRKESLEALSEERRAGRQSKARIRFRSRIDEVLDKGSASPLFGELATRDPLGFPGYAEKLAGLTKRSGLPDAVLCKSGRICGCGVVCVELLPEVLMGSMGTVVGETVALAAEYALEQRLALIIFAASGGARMQEGMFSLMQMAKTAAAVRRLAAAGGLFISVLCHPTTGGVTASFASLGDIILAEPGALIGFAGPRVIEQTLGTKLPEGFQSAEFQLKHGFVDAVVAREKLRETLGLLLRLHVADVGDVVSAGAVGASAGAAAGAGAVGASAGAADAAGTAGASNAVGADPGAADAAGEADKVTGAEVSAAVIAADAGIGAASDAASAAPLAPDVSPASASATSTPTITASERVALARDVGRPRIGDFISQLFEDFFETHGDRLYADDRSLICGIARFEGRPVTLAGHVKGTDLSSNIACNFGMSHPEGYRKFQRAIAQAEKFGRPVITFIDTSGAYPGTGAEERGQGEAIARCLFDLSQLRVPTIAVITGEGGSGGALALGLADKVLMYENAIYSILSPEGFASILWKDASRAAEAAELMRLTAADLKEFAMIDGIVPEPPAGAGADEAAASEAIFALRPLLRQALAELSTLGTSELLERRYQRYRRFN
jgi:acetyl-CoA carboxylase carboxyl transferase subunit beta